MSAHTPTLIHRPTRSFDYPKIFLSWFQCSSRPSVFSPALSVLSGPQCSPESVFSPDLIVLPSPRCSPWPSVFSPDFSVLPSPQCSFRPCVNFSRISVFFPDFSVLHDPQCSSRISVFSLALSVLPNLRMVSLTLRVFSPTLRVFFSAVRDKVARQVSSQFAVLNFFDKLQHLPSFITICRTCQVS